jgi:IS5 family transposase
MKLHLKEFEGATLHGNKGYSCKENDNLLKKRKIKNCLMRKVARNRPLTRGQKIFNKMKSKHHYRVEQAFGTLKRLSSPLKCNTQLLEFSM